jgi:prophage antirepressor-like protein
MGALSTELVFDGHCLRMVGTSERPEWIASDVCSALDLRESNPWRHLPDGCKGKVNALTPGGWQKVVTVNEEGLYRLISRSRVPRAEAFRKKVFGEVIPCIRQHGCYPAPDQQAHLPAAVNLRDPLQLAALTLQLTTFLAEKDHIIAELAPKAEAHDRLENASGLYCLLDAGRMLKRKPQLLIRSLIADRILFRGADRTPEPFDEYRERGYFDVRVVTIGVDDEGKPKTKKQTRVTVRGLQWLATRYPATDRTGDLIEQIGKKSRALLPAGH